MAWGGSSDPQKFEKALEWFATKAVLTREEWDRLAQREATRAFTVSGVAQLDVVAEVHARTEEAIATGEDFAEWKQAVQADLQDAWQGSVQRPGHRLETIYRNALQSSYNAGRWQQQSSPAVATARPYLIFDAILDGATTETCRSRDGVTLHRDDPFWQHSYPPLHHRCRSAARTTTKGDGQRREAEGMGDTSATAEVREGWGRTAADSQWEPNPDDYPAPLWAAFERARSERSVPPRITEALDAAVPT